MALSYFSPNISFNLRNTSASPGAIDLPAMYYPHDENDEHLVEDFVDDAVVADTGSTQAAKLTLQVTSLYSCQHHPTIDSVSEAGHPP